MKSVIVKIVDSIGIHARPASKITNEATKYKSNKVEIQAIGSDEDKAILGVQQVMKETKLI